MTISGTLKRSLAAFGVLAMVGACELPRSGPYYSELTEADGTAEYGFEVLEMTPEIARTTTVDERSGFSVKFIQTKAEPYYLIERGDTLSGTVWENSDEGLLSSTGVGASALPHAKVDERGQRDHEDRLLERALVLRGALVIGGGRRLVRFAAHEEREADAEQPEKPGTRSSGQSSTA